VTSKHVVVVGGGFGGLQLARGLKDAPVKVTLVDRQNFHLFQPLAYQVATGALSAVEIAVPLRSTLRRQDNSRVLMAEVTGFDLDERVVHLGDLPNGEHSEALHYDVLAVAGGSAYNYFGHDDWAEFAPELKTLEGALHLRSRIFSAFEAAEIERDERRKEAWLTFVVVGAGPTGVEMAGQIAEIAHDTLRRDFRRVDTRIAKVILVEAVDRVLTSFPPRLSGKALRSLEELGVTPMLDTTVVDIRAGAVEVQRDGGRETIQAETVVWAAGVTASPLASMLAEQSGAETDRVGRVVVEPDLTLPGRPEVFAFGDMSAVKAAAGGVLKLPGVAPVAMQQGRHVARSIRNDTRTAFRYRDKGNLATIGRSHAVAEVKGLQLSGFVAWVTWLGVHLVYLIGFQNRLLVLTRWTWSYLTRGRGARVIHD
jgi:NADH:quinone reductase (non-electrogenic)